MNTSIKKESKLLAKHSMIYGLGNVFNRVVGFLMIPVYTRFLSPADYGILEIVTLTTQVIALVASAGLTQAIGRYYFQYETEKDHNEVLSTSIFGFSILSLIIILPVLWMTPFLAKVLLETPHQNEIFLVAIAGIWFTSLSQIGFLYLRILKQSTRFLIFSLIKLILNLSLNILFIVVLKTGVIGILYSTLISDIIFTIILIIPLLRHTGIGLSIPKLREMLRFGLPVVPASLGNMVVLTSDKFFLRFFASLADTGLYSLATRFAVIPGQFFVYPFMQIWTVRRLEIYKQENSERIMGQVFTYFCLVLSAVGLAVVVLSKDVIEIMADPKFWPAYKAVPILVLSQIIVSFFQHFNFGIIIHKKTRYFAYIDLINAAVNLTLNYFLIRRFGIMGAAYATLISYTLRVVMVYLITIHLYRIYFEGMRVAKLFISCCIIYSVGLYISLDSVIYNLVVKSLILFFFPIILFMLKFFNQDELLWVKSVLNERRLFFRRESQ